MFSFFKKQPPVDTTQAAPAPDLRNFGLPPDPVAPAPGPVEHHVDVKADAEAVAAGAIAAPATESTPRPAPMLAPAPLPVATPVTTPTPMPVPAPQPSAAEAAEIRRPWLDRLRHGLRRTGTGITQVFTGTRIDESLYEELEAALLMADAGLPATEHLLSDLKQRVKAAKASDPQAVKGLLADAVAHLLQPLQQPLVIGPAEPTVIMVVGVNGAGKTTSIGKLTRHLADSGEKVLLAAADTFRAAAKEQLAVWADRAGVAGTTPGARGGSVDIVSQAGADPAAVVFDAVKAGQARRCQVVIADTAGRLPTQTHLMEELRKIHRTLGRAMEGAPHEVLLVVDGNTGQNALAQVKAFDQTLGLTGLVVTKLDGTAKGGVLAAIALWSRGRDGGPVPVYFVGVGEKLEDLETFDAREFAQALLS